MAVASTDLKFYLSGGSVGASNTDPDVSLGGAITATQVGTNLFDNIDSTESADGDTEYRLLFVKNTNETDTAYTVKVWWSSAASGNGGTPSTATSVQIALADEGVSASTEIIANEGTAPATVVFDDAEDLTNALTIGDLTPGQYYGVWVKRVVTAGAAAFSNDGATLTVRADTGA